MSDYFKSLDTVVSTRYLKKLGVLDLEWTTHTQPVMLTTLLKI